jgi:hypothetical protein
MKKWIEENEDQRSAFQQQRDTAIEMIKEKGAGRLRANMIPDAAVFFTEYNADRTARRGKMTSVRKWQGKHPGKSLKGL